MYESKATEKGITRIEITNGRGLVYNITVHAPNEKRPWNGFSLGDSPVYPLSDIPYIIEALMGVYVTALDAAAKQRLEDS